jgi:hypothetical protein
MTNRLILGIACALIAKTTTAQPLVRQRLDSLFDVLAAKNLAMGSIAISKNGRIIYKRSIGNAKEASDAAQTGEKPASPNTEYRIGSITKLFTATIVFQLIEEKRLYLDDKLSAYFPDLPNAKQITIANLLDHLAIAYCTNGEVWSKNWLLDAIRSILFEPDYVIPTFNPVKLSITKLDADTGRYHSKEGIEATVSRKGDELVLDTKGTSFLLVALDEKRFWNKRFGFFFDIDANNLTIYDVEAEYYLQKQ